MKNITEEYVIGEEVICRKYIKTMGTQFNVNFKFRDFNISLGILLFYKMWQQMRSKT